MVRKSGVHRQQKIFTCTDCNEVFKKNSLFIVHMKEKHGIEK
jgi:uncharacterized C2H2 Zn-finger protein